MDIKKRIEKKWIKSFRQCPLVDQGSGTYECDLAYQLFYGKNQDSYPEGFPHGFNLFEHTCDGLDKDKSIEALLKFLHFIGIGIHREKIAGHLAKYPDDFTKLIKKSFFIFRTLAHYGNRLDLTNPYKDNIGDISFLLRIESGESIKEGSQLNIFEEIELPDLYSRFKNFPDGYEDDKEVNNLFEKIENSNNHFFITGKAGTGKSTFTHYFARNSKKKILMCAFTGIAAINMGGQTIHSFFRFPLKPLMPEDDEIKIFNSNDPKRKLIEEINTIIIDEVSMLRSDILDAIDFSLRRNGGDPDKIFGGKQLLFVGDIFQLPPVVNHSEEIDRLLFGDVYKSEYFFNAYAYQKASSIFYEFKKVHRQNDSHFIQLLDKVRNCRADEDDIALLNERYDPAYAPQSHEFIIILCATNYIARRKNMRKLQELKFTLFTFEASVDGTFSEDKFPTDRSLELKKGSQVIFVKNDPERRWVNGTIGKIEFVSDDLLMVKMQDGNSHKIFKETWENMRYKYDKSKRKIVSEVIGTFTQYPIKLAWAITIHKSQGLTFDRLIIDLGTGAFVNGQLYTALSRCRTLNGIILNRKIKLEDIIVDKRIVNFYETERILSLI